MHVTFNRRFTQQSRTKYVQGREYFTEGDPTGNTCLFQHLNMENPNELPVMSMTEYKMKRDSCRQKIASKYDIQGFISSGTYGRVYKAKSKNKYGGGSNFFQPTSSS